MVKQNGKTQQFSRNKYSLYNSIESNFVWKKSNTAKYDLDAP